MRYLSEYLDKEVPHFIKNGVRLNFIGRIEGLPEDVKPKVKKSVDASKGGKTLSLNVALNYSGRTEIVDAARAFARLVKEGKAEADDLDEKMFSGLLDTAGQPDPDLLIRTSGEMRLSNFLLWQISYSEIYITPKFWPDFRKNDLVEAVREFQKRERRFGA
jgi:undecaprenyl diphosphate synthase